MATATTAAKRTIALFDIDGTLTVARKRVEPHVLDFIARLREKVTVGIVGGSDFVKAKEQLGDDLLDRFDYVFSENGTTAFKAGASIGQTSMAAHLGEDKLQRFINFVLRYLADVELPVKRGTFVEFRAGMLNISPIGRACSRDERNAFEAYDKEHNVRKTMVARLREEFADYGLTFSIGGQISFDVFPTGWDKTFALRYLEDFDTIHFWGDKTYEGGNDYEIFSHESVVGHTVTSPEDTLAQLDDLFFKDA